MNIDFFLGTIKNYIKRIICSIFGVNDIYQIWDASKTYHSGDLVIYEDNLLHETRAYVAIQDIDVGRSITDTFYWKPIKYMLNTSYTFIQNTASDNWSIVHNLNKYPSVSIVDNENNEILGNINYINENEININFSTAISGTCYLN